jgi:hypothetical protein
MDLDSTFICSEPDAEIRDLLRASLGLNLAVDFLPGSVMFNPARHSLTGGLASAIVWFDACVGNVDRTARNTNMLMWHGRPWLIDHGSALYFHHTWHDGFAAASASFSIINDHVLLRAADHLTEADASLRGRFTTELLEQVVSQVPDAWLLGDEQCSQPDRTRAAYVEMLSARVDKRAELMEALHSARVAALSRPVNPPPIVSKRRRGP